MTDSLPQSQVTAAEDSEIIRATHVWLERAVIGLNLCPFARVPFTQGCVRFRVSHATDEGALLQDLGEELNALHAADPETCETTLLIHPQVLTDFFDYNDFLGAAEATVAALGLEGDIQVASFHPDYRFADTDPDAIENYTNRSPYPMLHLLREASIEHAVESVPDPDAIYERNIETMRKLGIEGWRRLMRDEP